MDAIDKLTMQAQQELVRGNRKQAQRLIAKIKKLVEAEQAAKTKAAKAANRKTKVAK